MFNNYEINSQYLRVRFATPRVKNDDTAAGGGDFRNGGGRSDFMRKQGLNKSNASEDENWDEPTPNDSARKSFTASRSDCDYKADHGESRSKIDSASVVSLCSTSSNKKPMGRGQVINSVKEKCK
jgi:hypothetical protein